MKTPLASIIKKVQARMDENWYIDTTASLNDAIWTFVFSDCLRIEDQLNQIRRGSYFSYFNYDEIKFVKKYDAYIAICMDLIWTADNQWCSELDNLPLELMEDGVRDDDMETYGRYRDSIEVNYLYNTWMTFGELEEYVAENYAIIEVDIDVSRYDDINNYFYYEPGSLFYKKGNRSDEPELPGESIPVLEEYSEEILAEDGTEEFAEVLSERIETTSSSEASPEDFMVFEVTEETPLNELKLSVRSYNCLRRAGVQTIMQLTRMNDEELNKVRNLGKKCQKEIKNKLARLGLSRDDALD